MTARRRTVLLLAALATVMGPRHAPGQPTDPLGQVRHAYAAAVEDEAAIPVARELVEAARVAEGGADGERDSLFGAYVGALTTLRAKHAFWPPTRLRHLRAGLAVLDDAVRRRPDDPEVRYLRLMSCFYLPRILGRQWSVREDFAALGRLLPAAAGDYPREMYVAVATFVLENGDLDDEARRRLEAAVNAGGGMDRR